MAPGVCPQQAWWTRRSDRACVRETVGLAYSRFVCARGVPINSCARGLIRAACTPYGGHSQDLLVWSLKRIALLRGALL